jgi:hypothetical protein
MCELVSAESEARSSMIGKEEIVWVKRMFSPVENSREGPG